MKEDDLNFLEPKQVLREFYKLCSMPHGSGNIQMISDYLVSWAKDHNLSVTQETCGNVVMRKPGTAGYEDHPTVVLQGHMDMVAVKEPGICKDMETEGLDLETDGEFLYAKGTTLGGDDGIALAYAMAILASDDIPHPPLELLATVNEETGMDGAIAFDPSLIKGRILLNIDSEEEGTLLTGCAGGATIRVKLPVEREERAGDACEGTCEEKTDGACVTGSSACARANLSVRLYGLAGGHSGTEIDKGHKNAILELATLLRVGTTQAAFGLVSISGGEKDNAIPCDAEAIISCDAGEVDKVIEALQDVYDLFAGELAEAEAGVKFMIAKVGEEPAPMTEQSTEQVLELLCRLPFGVAKMSEDLEGIVETSNNVGICKTEGDEVVIALSVRSMKEEEKEKLCAQIGEIAKEFGAEVSRNSEYPGWSYRPHSPLREKMVEVYTAMYGEPPMLQAIHAGLECGLLIQKLPDLDCVSFGPNIFDIHTTKERLDLASTKRVWEYILELLKEM